MKTTTDKLQAIFNQYCTINHNEDNFYIGGGLDRFKFASRRHEDAKEDGGKLTLGQATQLFKKATGLETNIVSELLQFAIPNMEWHHAGKLPKAYGGGMKKTYFLNSEEICDVAKNWDKYISEISISTAAAKVAADNKKTLEEKKLEFLKENAKRIDRMQATSRFSNNLPKFFYITSQEMEGKFGWFDSTYKSYKLPEYFSGWAFENEEKYNEFIKLT